MKKKTVKSTLLYTLLIFFLFSLNACHNQQEKENVLQFEQLSDFNNTRMAVLTGSPYEQLMAENFHGITYRNYDDLATMIMALRKGDVEGIVFDSPVIRYMSNLHSNEFAEFPEPTVHYDFGLLVKKNSKYKAQMSAIIEEMLADGSMEKLKEKWFSGDEKRMVLDWSQYNIAPRKNGVLRFAFDPNAVPMIYIGPNNQAYGLEAELMAIIADKMDMGLEMYNTKLASLIMYVNQDKADVAASCLIITKERLESADFCTSHYKGGAAVLCRRENMVKICQEMADTLDLSRPGTIIASEVNTIPEIEAKKAFPQSETFIVNDATNGFLAVRNKKAQAFAIDKFVFDSYLASGKTDLKIYKNQIIGEKGKIAAGISKKTKIDHAKKLINEFITEMQEKGILQDMHQRWKIDHNYEMPEIATPQNPTFTIKVGTTGLVEPCSFYEGGQLTGFEIELAKRFALWCNAELELSSYDWAGVLTAAKSGKVDYVFSNLFQTPEREDAVDFSLPYSYVETILAVPNQPTEVQEASFWDGIKESFNKTFVRESRWKLILNGIGITLIITLFAGIFGTIIGFLLCLGIRAKNSVIQSICRGFSTLMQGIPELVILMIAFFVIFGSVDIHPVIVGIIAFSFIFAISVADILNTGIEAIDRGQWEAATSLGFGKVNTFSKVIMPQAVRHVLPLYSGEFVQMMKLTSIVGYISIEDLTKVGDIIRSRTYEAFFPLIAIAIIYFILSGLIAWGMSKISQKIDPKRKARKLPKGVQKSAEEKAEEKEDSAIASTPASTAQEVPTMIEVEHLQKVYPDVTPLKDVNATIHGGEVITIIGPSGTGKSTFLRCINRLEEPTAGKIVVLGKDTSDKKTDLKLMRQKTGMVFQSFNLFGHLTVIENIMLAPVTLKLKTKQEAYDKGMELLRQVGMAAKALAYPDELSGGQKQRIAIARTLAMDPDIVLFDEPTSALDPTMVGEVLSVIRNLAKQGLTMLIVTHEMSFARDVSTRIFYMDQGLVYEDGTPEQIFEHPQKERTRQFIRKLKVLEISIDSKDFDFIDINNQIDQFCKKNLLDQRTVLRIQNIFEEICVQSLVPQFTEAIHIRYMIEYSNETNSIQVTIQYHGTDFNPLEEGDELSIMMVKGSCKQTEYQTLEVEDQLIHEIKLTLK